jgi:hypothetical protein
VFRTSMSPRRRQLHGRRGFALIELPLVFLFLSAGGLLVAYLFSLFSGPAPWYAWVIASVTLPALLFALCFVFAWIETITRLPDPPKSPATDRSTTE